MLLDAGDPPLYSDRCSRAEALLCSQTEQVDSSTLHRVLIQKPSHNMRYICSQFLLQKT